MLTGKEKRYLRSLAATRKAVVIVGKEGISANLIQSLHDALEAHELVKISVLKNCDDDLKELAFDLAAATNSEIVQSIGRVFVLYKRSKKNLLGL
ncbi:MAG: ribosome assembly RNA-binding protein YhbY [Erysipelotrichia bacterium]|nr:ribosome assembly RNA-binding protein YhbY [Erysipelotrichia bacterium]NCC54280.1 ribosome assembly RNA-binding protein YhbY [Erysipelotrichia bacterium]